MNFTRPTMSSKMFKDISNTAISSFDEFLPVYLQLLAAATTAGNWFSPRACSFTLLTEGAVAGFVVRSSTINSLFYEHSFQPCKTTTKWFPLRNKMSIYFLKIWAGTPFSQDTYCRNSVPVCLPHYHPLASKVWRLFFSFSSLTK